ncbi:DUF4352 domain-containing protein [Streptomyces sp. ms191]|uniref:DUF4352 domain-containing protein n=1 Tax=Streptomyces sp. ms191 TaxID=1827978 RepID=UPI0011CE0E68|nr:DUF4352 domain-containing protein [Streptomyces sp. ms191]TXS33009.1 DUF4352 domain-containing protein [Streptomyces sp. ms191]
MSQQYPHQQPGDEPTQQTGPQSPPLKKRSKGKIAGFGCLGIVALFIVIGALGNGGDSGDSGDSENPGTPAAKSSAPAARKPAPKRDAAKDTKETGPVTVTAKKTRFAKSILADSTDYTSVLVTIKNDGDKAIDVNPLYLTITDTAGTKHTAELGVDEKQIATVKLSPGENVSGTVTGKGTFTPKYVTYTDGLIGDSVRGNVS